MWKSILGVVLFAIIVTAGWGYYEYRKLEKIGEDMLTKKGAEMQQRLENQKLSHFVTPAAGQKEIDARKEHAEKTGKRGPLTAEQLKALSARQEADRRRKALQKEREAQIQAIMKDARRADGSSALSPPANQPQPANP